MTELRFDRLSVNINNLFLDPNNLRLHEVEEEVTEVKQEEIMDPDVQAETFAGVCREENINELQRSILHTRGPVEAPIVVYINEKDDENFMVLEGNRRVACVRRLLRRAQDGLLSEEYKADFGKITVLLLPREFDTKENRRLILGTRHVTGVKDWGPYQRARIIKQFKEEEGKSYTDTGNILGMSAPAVGKLYRALNAFEDFCHETGSKDVHRFSYFVEAVGKTSIQNWLRMDDEGHFEKEERHELYKWILGDEENEIEPKMRKAEQIRDLAKIIEKEEAFDEFRSEDGSLESALAIVGKYRPLEWIPTFRKVVRIIMNMPLSIIEEIPQNPKHVELVDELQERVKWLRGQIRRRSRHKKT